MHQTRRRQSTNHKLHNPSPPTNRRPGAAQDTEEPGHDNCSRTSDDHSAIGKKSSNVAPRMSALVGVAGELHRVSSFGSCSTWNTLDPCPATPSPVCSPLSPRSAVDDDASFATPDQSSCVISDGGEKDEASRGKTLQESRRKVAANHYCSMKRGRGDEGSGRYENSDMESYASTVHPRRVRDSDMKFGADNGRNRLEEKLTAWKETRMMKLMQKLRRDEAAIDKWEMKKTARDDAKRVETKLDKKWSRELKGMQRRIRDVQEEAEKRKVRERAIAAEKITKVERTAVTGKLPWWFRFL